MSFFIKLVELTDAERRELENAPKIHSMIHQGLTRDEYCRLLHNLYHIVWHFCPVMAVAAARCRDRFRGVRHELYARLREGLCHQGRGLADTERLRGDGAEPPEERP